MENAIKNLMSTNVVSVNPQQSLKEAAEMMVQNDIGAVPVVENGQIRGIITDRDITTRATAMGKDGNCTVGECMSGELTTADASMDVHQAAQLMAEKQIRRLPVTENGQLAGMLSLGDLATQNIFQNEAGQALSNISFPAHNQQAQQQGQQAGQQQTMQQNQAQQAQMGQQQAQQQQQQNQGPQNMS
ncbi:CBS domain-containing protein [Aquisalibacillus elongatus]|uniref:CBS domain-containing protein n=1 Tax=Aquisalibacillus elongatus TaxID=485577 RepID=A0A3N5B7U8_9BACI|nr:CBS domain-containing protein [Aquisalibacillus elongatus]RPF53387.1 CBS domain-containing protein [Aquisalibacillus elongatus]